LPGQGTLAGAYLGGILVSGDILYVATMQGIVDAYTLLHHPISGLNSDRYVIATYNAETGNVVNFGFFRYPYLGLFVPRGMALSGTNLYVANYQESTISKINTTTGGGNAFFIPFIVNRGPEHPYALAVNGNVLYVTNNYQNSNGDFYISTYTADTGALINANFIQIPTGGLYGLALKNNVFGVA
jgi:DNA-binding beta-propeller fold protein YncE